MKPLVSIILAVYNGELYLREALESILAQSYDPFEIIFVDDGSTDRTAEIVKSYGAEIRYFYQPNRGQPAAVNQGIRLATGTYLSFLDGDDLYLPDKTALQVAYLQAHPHIDFVFGQIKQFISPELPVEIMQKWACPSALETGYLAVAGMFHKKCFEQVGLFNEQQRIGVFIEWYMRAMDLKLQEGLIPDLILRRRIHQNNMGIQNQHARLQYIQIVKAALKRRQCHV